MKHLASTCLLVWLFLTLSCGDTTSTEPIGEKNLHTFFGNPSVRKVLTAQDRRQTQELLPYLGDSFPREIRLLAARSFASVQDTEALPGLIPLLGDPDPEIRKAAAWSLGQTGSMRAQHAMMEQYDREAEGEIKNFLLENIGKCGDSSALSWIIRVPAQKLPNAATGIARSLYRFGLRKLISPAGTRLCREILGDSSLSAEARLFAAHYFGRVQGISAFTNPSQAEELFESLSKTAISTPDPLIRAQLVRALGRFPDTLKSSFFLVMAENEKDLNVKVALLRYAPDLPDNPFSKYAGKWIYDGNANLSKEAALFFERNAKWTSDTDLLAISRKVTHWQSRAILLKSATLNAGGIPEGIPKHDNTPYSEKATECYDFTMKLYADTKIPEEKGMLLNAIAQSSLGLFVAIDSLKGFIPEARQKPGPTPYPIDPQIIQAEILLPEVVRLAQESFRMVDLKGRKKIGDLLARCIRSGDIALVAITADLLPLRQMLTGQEWREENTRLQQELESAKSSLWLPAETEALYAIENALARMKGLEPPQHAAPAPTHPIPFENLEALPVSGGSIRIETGKGNIVMNLFPREAPGTVANFVELAEKGFFDGKIFHRVIADFVAQGGCPRGDGWGSQSYTICSEFGIPHYTTGSVGVASAGKDTESCQFFITHSPTPHLDGRYTIFGVVTEGMDIVESLTVRDTIQKMRVVWSAN